MRPAGRRSFLSAAALMIAAALVVRDTDAAPLDVSCQSSNEATLTVSSQNASYYCGDNSSDSTQVFMDTEFEVKIQVQNMTLILQSGIELVTLRVTGVSGTPTVAFSKTPQQQPLNLTALYKLTSLYFDGVSFASESVQLSLPQTAKELHVVNSRLGDLSLIGDRVDALKTIDLQNARFREIPTILYQYTYSETFIEVDLSLVQHMTNLSSANYTSLMKNVGTEVNKSCRNGVVSNETITVQCGLPDSTSTNSSHAATDGTTNTISHSSSGSAADASTRDDSSSGVSTGVIVAIVVVVVVIVVVLAFFILRTYIKRKAANANAHNNDATATLMSKSDAAADKGSFISNDEFLRNFRLPQSDVALVKSLGTGRLWMGEYNGNKVVVKRVESEVTDSYVTKALMAQARTFAIISHPNITNLVGVTWLAGTDFAVVTEFMDKGNLTTVLANTDMDLDVTTKLQMCCDVALALAYLHETEQNLCAKQLSSRKVLVNKTMNCKLSLFECVPSSTKLGGPSTTVTYSYGMGEVAWLPPEVVTRSSPMDARKNNIYAFGVLVSEIFTRVSPYQSLIEGAGNTMSDVELVKRARRQEPLKPHENRRGFLDAPASVRQMVEQCLSYAPMSRPTAKELVEILHNAKEKLATNSI